MSVSLATVIYDPAEPVKLLAITRVGHRRGAQRQGQTHFEQVAWLRGCGLMAMLERLNAIQRITSGEK